MDTVDLVVGEGGVGRRGVESSQTELCSLKCSLHNLSPHKTLKHKL